MPSIAPADSTPDADTRVNVQSKDSPTLPKDTPHRGAENEGSRPGIRDVNTYLSEAKALKAVSSASSAASRHEDIDTPPGAPFPQRLFVAKRWDVGEKFYQHIHFLINWIEAKLESTDPEDALGEDFMRPDGSTVQFSIIWEAFFAKVVAGESSSLLERLQTGLRVKREPEKIQQCLEFTYGVGAGSIFAALLAIGDFCRKHHTILSSRTLQHLKHLHALLSMPSFPSETITVPADVPSQSHPYDFLDQLNPKLVSLRPYLPPKVKEALREPNPKPKSEKEKAVEMGVDHWVQWRAFQTRGIRPPDENLPWAPSEEQFGMASWGEFHMAHIASQSMISEWENAGPIGSEGRTPFLYEVTGTPMPLEWDYQEWTQASARPEIGDENANPETILPLQHFIAHDELPDILLVEDPDELTLPSNKQSTRAKSRKNEDSDDRDASDGAEAVSNLAASEADGDDEEDEPAVPSRSPEDVAPEEDKRRSDEAIRDNADAPALEQNDNAIEDASSLSAPASVPPLRPRLLRYRRVNPLSHEAAWAPPPPPDVPKKPAYLSFSQVGKIGEGHSARVWDGAISFDFDTKDVDSAKDNAAESTDTREAQHASLAGSPVPPKLSVAVKIPFTTDTAEDFVRNEARTYTLFPPGLSRDYNGYIMPPKARNWVPHPTCAIVPKYYGYYLPEPHETDVLSEYRKPILLMEKCGRPVPDRQRVSRKDSFDFTDYHQETIFAMLQRLHYAGFTQNSFSARNILYQPGPLSVPPSQRSLSTPSFRIIDFGRGVCDYFPVDRDPSKDDEKQNLKDDREADDEEYTARNLFSMSRFG